MVPLRTWVKPSEVVPMFPGGPGLHGSRFPHQGIMIIMQDFDAEASYRRAVDHGYTASQDSTSVRAAEILKEAGVNLSNCYFTNRFVGVRDAETQYGANPGWRSPKSSKQHGPYVKMCNEMLGLQLKEQKPRLVLTYGAHVPRSLGFNNLWSDKLVMKASVLGHVTTLAALVHTSFRPSNVGKVKYGGLMGHKAEIKLIKDALYAAGF